MASCKKRWGPGNEVIAGLQCSLHGCNGFPRACATAKGRVKTETPGPSRGLDAPAKVTEATQDYLESQDVIGHWIEDRCRSIRTPPSRALTYSGTGPTGRRPTTSSSSSRPTSSRHWRRGVASK